MIEMVRVMTCDSCGWILRGPDMTDILLESEPDSDLEKRAREKGWRIEEDAATCKECLISADGEEKEKDSGSIPIPF